MGVSGSLSSFRLKGSPACWKKLFSVARKANDCELFSYCLRVPKKDMEVYLIDSSKLTWAFASNSSSLSSVNMGFFAEPRLLKALWGLPGWEAKPPPNPEDAVW
jgi:hypothetical protein